MHHICATEVKEMEQYVDDVINRPVFEVNQAS